jgi:hypothetical protein
MAQCHEGSGPPVRVTVVILECYYGYYSARNTRSPQSQSIDSVAVTLKGDMANSEGNQFPGHISNYYLGNKAVRPFLGALPDYRLDCRSVGSDSVRSNLWNG